MKFNGGFIEVCAVRLKREVAEKEYVDPDSLHWVRRELSPNGKGNGAKLIVESRISGRTPVIFTITEDEVHEISRQFLRETLGREPEIDYAWEKHPLVK